MVFILTVLSLFWGALFKAYQNANRLKIAIVNFDNGADAFVGPMITNVFLNERQKNPMTLGFEEHQPSEFDNNPLKVREAVYYYDYYGAVIINSNASYLLQQAVETGNSSYDPMGAGQLIYNEARDQDAYYDFIYTIMYPLQIEIVSQFGRMWAGKVLANSTLNNPSTLARAPQALSPAIGFSTFNLRPFYIPVAIPAVSVGLIYLIIISFFSFSFFMPIHSRFMDKSKHAPLKPMQHLLWRWLSTVVAYLLLALAYSLVSLAFQIPFRYGTAPADQVSDTANAYGYGSFVIYWMINFFGMFALGMACENMAMILGMPWTSMWLIFWVITNVISAFYPLQIEPRFYYWGYAWPLHHIVEASRTIIFDTQSSIGLNFGVLIAWCAVNTALYPFASWVMKWKMQRGQKKGQ